MTHVSIPPKLSVLMPVRDAGAFLGPAIESVRRQTWRDFEVILVDDGSTDGSLEHARGIARADNRIRVMQQERLGLVAALNRAAIEAKGEFWARMDADDLSRPERFERQLRALAAAPGVGVLGTAVRRFGAQRGGWWLPEHDGPAKAALLFGTPFAHPTVMLRHSIWAETGVRYRVDFRAAEDIDLWERLSERTRFANLREPLLDYRVHASQVTAIAGADMAANGARVRRRVLQRLGIEPSESDLEVHERVTWLRTGSPSELSAARVWLERLRAAAANQSWADASAVRAAVARQWFEFCNAHSKLGWLAWREYRLAEFVGDDPTDWRRRFRFLLLCALRQPNAGNYHA